MSESETAIIAAILLGCDRIRAELALSQHSMRDAMSPEEAVVEARRLLRAASLPAQEITDGR